MLIERASRFPHKPPSIGPGIAILLNLLATVHLVWFYLSRTECYIKLLPYEEGKERTPFQYRLLLIEPMRWAHQSSLVHAAASWLTLQKGFFPGGVRPEGIAQAAIDTVCIGIAGMVATKLYERTSRTGVLTPYVYPLTLIMVLSTYTLFTMHAYRFLYDMPSLACFSLGLYLIYARKHVAGFVAVFLIGTLNRETTLLLLVFFMLAQCSRGEKLDWRQSYAVSTLGLVLPLATFWFAWHLGVAYFFRNNLSAAHPHLWLNASILAVPFTWPQLMAVFAYLLPMVLLYRKYIRDRVLRAWLWALPVWFAFMLYYGVFVEIRIFGELIPYIACISALIAEERLLGRLQLRTSLSGEFVNYSNEEAVNEGCAPGGPSASLERKRRLQGLHLLPSRSPYRQPTQ